MAPQKLDDDLALALALVEWAGELSLPAFRAGVAARTKADGTPVTEVDLEVERCLAHRLAEERPDDGVLGEELGATGSSSRRWILDPIDGTFNFVAGRPQWGTHVALQEGAEIVLGVISRPATGKTWWALRGAGAHRSESPVAGDSTVLRVSAQSDFAASRVSIWAPTGAPGELDARLARLAEQTIRSDSDLDDILKLAEGGLEAVIDVAGRPWDHAPAVVIVEEAGGRFSDSRGGRRIDLGEGRYSNGHIHEPLSRALDDRS